MSSIFLPLPTQEIIFRYLNVMVVLSTTLNVIGLFFLLLQTPTHQSTIRNYLILIQILLMISDIHLEIGFHPIPLFPAYAGYAVGLLIQMGFSTHLELSITIIFYIWIGVSILLCILYRHQTIFLEGNAYKLSQTTIRLFQCSLTVIITLPALVYAFNGNDSETVEKYLIEDPHNLTWIRDRGSYYVETRTPNMILAFIIILCILIFGSAAFIFIFIHMFHVLHQDTDKRSEQSIQLIRKSLRALFLQLVIPLILFIFPTASIFFGLTFENLFSFEVSMSFFLLLPWHSVGHNFILLTITSAYRNRILSFLKFIVTCKKTQIVRKETRVHQSTTNMQR